MRSRRERILKLSCLVLGAVLASQLIRFILVGDPAKGLVIPSLPSLPPELDAQIGKGTNAVAAMGTNITSNQASGKIGTNNSTLANQSNSVSVGDAKKIGVEAHLPSKPSDTNSVAGKQGLPGGSNSVIETNVSSVQASSNLTNGLLSSPGSTNVQTPLSAAVTGTNSATNIVGLKTGTNSNSLNASGRTNAFPPGRMMMGGGKPPELPAEIKERVERIVQGEILGQVIRPMPMALLGIAGPHAFLRSPDGQTGMIKEGEKLGNLKLIRIGNNRVLVEEEGEKKELSIFAGLGSETLMPAKEPSAKENKPNEPLTKSPSKTN